MNKLNHNIIIFTIFAIYFSHYFILGENTYLLIHDNLDSTLVQYKLLADFGYWFKDSTFIIPTLGQGIPRLSFPSELSIANIFLYLLPVFWAYFCIVLLNHSLGFFGMRLLLRHLDKSDENKNLVNYSSLCFSLIPFWPFGFGTASLMPLCLYHFLKIRDREANWLNYLVLLIVPFYSSLILGFLFFLIFVTLIWVYDLVKKREFNVGLFVALGLQSLVFILVEYRLFENVLNPFVESHRASFSPHLKDIQITILTIKRHFLQGQYHAHSLHGLVILPLTIFTLFISFRKKELNSYFRKIISLVTLCLVISVWYGVWSSGPFYELKTMIPILQKFNFSRFYFLSPMFWGIILFYSLLILKKSKFKKAIPFIIFAQLAFCFVKSDFYQNVTQQKVSYKSFYKLDAFKELKQSIAFKSTDSFLSVGMFPEIARFHKLSTLDFYLPFYPLEYKKKFFKLIEPELSKNKKNYDYFTGWGSRAYLFSDELGKKIKNIKSCTIEDIQINYQAQLQPDYLLSPCYIENLTSKLIFTSKNKELWVYSFAK